MNMENGSIVYLGAGILSAVKIKLPLLTEKQKNLSANGDI